MFHQTDVTRLIQCHPRRRFWHVVLLCIEHILKNLYLLGDSGSLPASDAAPLDPYLLLITWMRSGVALW